MLCKKVFLIILLFLFLCSNFLFSFENFDFALESSIGVKSGKVDELVFENEKMISHLEWNILFLPTMNLKTNFEFNNFIFNFNCTSVVPTKIGNLKDYDFLSTDNNVTHFSKHDLIIDNDFSFNFDIGYNFLQLNKFSLLATIGFSYDNRKYSARDGYVEYAVKNELSGIVISYEQEIWYPFVKFDFAFIPNGFFEIKFSTLVFPYIFANTLDSHFLRQVQFYDVMRGGFGGELNLSLIAKFSKIDNLLFKTSLTYQGMSCKGISFTNNIGMTTSNFVLTENCILQIKSNFFTLNLGVVLKKSK